MRRRFLGFPVRASLSSQPSVSPLSYNSIIRRESLVCPTLCYHASDFLVSSCPPSSHAPLFVEGYPEGAEFFLCSDEPLPFPSALIAPICALPPLPCRVPTMIGVTFFCVSRCAPSPSIASYALSPLIAPPRLRPILLSLPCLMLGASPSDRSPRLFGH